MPGLQSIHENRNNEYKIIISFDDSIANALKYRWDQKNPANPAQICSFKEICEYKNLAAGYFQKYEIQIPENAEVKVDVVIHTSAGEDFGYFKTYDSKGNEKRAAIGYEALAYLLATYINNRYINNIRINLIACAAVKGIKKAKNVADNPVNSYAVKVQQNLSNLKKKDIPVIARTENVSTVIERNNNTYSSLGKKYTDKKITYETYSQDGSYWKTFRIVSEHKQPGTKVIISQNTIRDAYAESWKKNVLKELSILQKTTKLIEKQIFLRDWIAEFKEKSPEEMMELMKFEINRGQKSVLSYNSVEFLDLFRNTIFGNVLKYTPASFEKIEKLIAVGERYIQNRYQTREFGL